MVYFDLVQSIGCDMLCCLFQVTDSTGVFVFLNDSIQAIFSYYALFCLQAHTFQDFWKNVFGEDNFLLF